MNDRLPLAVVSRSRVLIRGTFRSFVFTLIAFMSPIISGFTSSGPSDTLRPSNYSPVDTNVSAKGSNDANDYILLGGEIALTDAVTVMNRPEYSGDCFV